MGDLTKFGRKGLAPQDMSTFDRGAADSRTMMGSKLFPILQYLRALGGADPNAESYRQAGFNAGNIDLANRDQSYNQPKPWEIPLSESAPGMAPAPVEAAGRPLEVPPPIAPSSPSGPTTSDDAFNMAREMMKRRELAKRIVPEETWNE